MILSEKELLQKQNRLREELAHSTRMESFWKDMQEHSYYKDYEEDQQLQLRFLQLSLEGAETPEDFYRAQAVLKFYRKSILRLSKQYERKRRELLKAIEELDAEIGRLNERKSKFQRRPGRKILQH